MKKILAVIPALCLGLVALTAKADPTLTFNSGGSAGPYNLTLSGSPSTNLSLFCMDDFLTIQTGESWTVDVILGSQLSSNSLTSSDAHQYEEEAYILSQFNGSNNQTIQDALWEVFDTSTSNKTSASVSLYNAATGSAGNTFIADGGYDNFVYYIYDNGTINDPVCSGEGRDRRCSDPQNFIGDPPPAATPEPSSLFLLGSGLFGLAGAARRKFRRA